MKDVTKNKNKNKSKENVVNFMQVDNSKNSLDGYLSAEVITDLEAAFEYYENKKAKEKELDKKGSSATTDCP